MSYVRLATVVTLCAASYCAGKSWDGAAAIWTIVAVIFLFVLGSAEEK